MARHDPEELAAREALRRADAELQAATHVDLDAGFADLHARLDVTVGASVLEDKLADYLGSRSVALELVACGQQRDWTPRVPDRPWRATDGYTDATLATLAITARDSTEKLILKVNPDMWREPAAHAAAEAECPPAFRQRLFGAAMPGWDMASGGFLSFQKLTADVADYRSMADLPAADLPAACELVVAWLIRLWNPELHLRRAPITSVLLDQMGPELATGGSIRSWAREAGLLAPEALWMRFRDDPTVYPNPLLLAHDGSPLTGETADILVGHCHGDLHLLNVLLPHGPGGPLRPEDFRLIDLSKYSGDGLVTTDPVVLMLSAIAHGLHRLSPDRREDLLHHLVGPASTTREGYLFDTVDRVVAAVAAEVGGRGLSRELRLQLRLSTIGIAVHFTRFTSLGPQIRWWFFRLAAHMARELFAYLDVPVPDSAPSMANPFPKTRPYSGSVAALASHRPIDQAVARAWRAALANPTAARAHLEEGYARVAETGASGGPQAVAKACRLTRDLVDDATQLLGREDPTTLWLLHQLAGWTHRSGDTVTALQTFRHVAALRARVLGAQHPDTIDSERRAQWLLPDAAAHRAYEP